MGQEPLAVTKSAPTLALTTTCVPASGGPRAAGLVLCQRKTDSQFPTGQVHIQPPISDPPYACMHESPSSSVTVGVYVFSIGAWLWEGTKRAALAYSLAFLELKCGCRSAQRTRAGGKKTRVKDTTSFSQTRYSLLSPDCHSLRESFFCFFKQKREHYYVI
jgi:hypothetical protein